MNAFVTRKEKSDSKNDYNSFADIDLDQNNNNYWLWQKKKTRNIQMIFSSRWPYPVVSRTRWAYCRLVGLPMSVNNSLTNKCLYWKHFFRPQLVLHLYFCLLNPHYLQYHEPHEFICSGPAMASDWVTHVPSSATQDIVSLAAMMRVRSSWWWCWWCLP